MGSGNPMIEKKSARELEGIFLVSAERRGIMVANRQ
jgi:hypothetical protein